MTGPSQAILWQLWRRNRWGLSAVATYLAVGVAVANIVPRDVRIPLTDDVLPGVGFYAALPCVWLAIFLAIVFTYSTVEIKDCHFPRHSFLLPTSTRALVFWPCVGGAATMTAAWFIVALGMLRPAGVSPPMWWPPAALALTLAIMQFISWAPLSLPRLRLLGALPLLLFPLVLGGAAYLLDLRESLVVAVLLGLLPAAYALCEAVVARARRGDAYDERLATWLAQRQAWRRTAAPPFASAGRAQLWFECRAHLWMLPAMTALWLACSLAVVLADRDNLNQTWRFLGTLVGLPALTATMMSVTLGKQDPRSTYPLPAFTAARPQSTAAIVLAKFHMAALSALIANAMTIPLIAIALFLRPGGYEAVSARLAGFSSWQVALAAAAMFGACVFATWAALIGKMWLGLTGRPIVVNAVTMLSAAAIFVALMLGWWLTLYPAWQPRLLAALPWVVGALASLKLALAAGVVTALRRARLIPPACLAVLAGAWLVAVATIVAALCWLARDAPMAIAYAAAAVVLAAPLSRLAAAPLALRWNRHR